MNGKQPERNHHSHAGPKRRGTLEATRLQEQVESDTHEIKEVKDHAQSIWP